MRNVGIAFAAILGGCGGGNMNNDEVSLPYTVRVSESAGERQADAASGWPSISEDGRYVAFGSTAASLVPGDTNDQEDVFVKDLQTGAIVRASTSSTGAEARGGSTIPYGPSEGDNSTFTGSSYPSISADGRYVAFQSFADDLLGLGEDTNERSDIFVKDLVTGTLRRVSLTDSDAQSQWVAPPEDPMNPKVSWYEGKGKGGAMYPSISEDGRYVAFESHHRDLVAIEKTQGIKDVYVRDLVLGTTTLVSMTYDGRHLVDHDPGAGFSSTACISADGRFVAFQSNLVAIPQTGISEVYVRDLKAQVTSRVSVTSDGLDGISYDSTAGSYGPRLSADGRFVAFISERSMVPGVPPYQIYLRDRARGTTVLVSQNAEGIPAAGGLFDIGSYSMSGDGRYVAFAALSPNLVADDLNDAADVFVRDVVGGTTVRVSVRTGGEEAHASRTLGRDEQGTAIGSRNPAISADGRFVAFQSDASDLVGADTNGASDIFLRGPLK